MCFKLEKIKQLTRCVNKTFMLYGKKLFCVVQVININVKKFCVY